MKFNDSPFAQEVLHQKVRFYLTQTGPCPYLEGQVERKVFTSLEVEKANSLHDLLSYNGFRRSQTIAYRPACPKCKACRATRVPVDDFTMSKRWRRVWNRNSDLVRSDHPTITTDEQFALLSRYLETRHKDGGMSDMDAHDYASMVEDAPVSSIVIEYRHGNAPDAPLIAAAIADVLNDGLSMVYSFFDPDFADRSLGSYIILDHIAQARKLGLSFVYLGYWVSGSRKMDYKAQFRPLQVLDGDAWRDIQDL